ncbi:MAG: hypothetical protein HYV39_02245 [Candidatus Levybacteria bacterium]|nr:hypothetical protein [Candidatus Levybacteria bacterium]
MKEAYKGIIAPNGHLPIHGHSPNAAGELITTTLPPDAPDNIVLSPTMNRWGINGQPAHLPNMLYSVQGALSREGLIKDTWVILGDASNQPGTDVARLSTLQRLHEIPHPSRLFLLTPETQRKTADIIAGKAKIPREIVDAVLTMTGYASQRAKLDVVAGGLALVANRPLKTLELDDDTIIPEHYGVLKEDVLPHGLTRKPNSQVLLDDREALSEKMFDVITNTISPFFTELGKTVGEVRQKHPGMRATHKFKDTMHGELEKAIKGESAQFVVTHADIEEDDLPDADNSLIVATTATKHGVPDYRTVKIAQAHLEAEFPEEEIPISSYPSGPSELFVYRKADTNVDSACIARQIDENTAFWPWWFVSNDRISRENPLQTVTGHYRADNELLPVWLQVVYERIGQQYAYLSGIDTQVYHNRARTGYRPDLHEQATASLVGNIAALEASRRLHFDPSAVRIRMTRVDPDYVAPRDHAEQVYSLMDGLAEICTRKLKDLSSRKLATSAPEDLRDIAEKTDKYLDVLGSIKRKLGGSSFETFYYHLNREVARQLNFFADVLDAMPTVIIEAQKLIQRGNYPVVEYVPAQASIKNHPGSEVVVFQR